MNAIIRSGRRQRQGFTMVELIAVILSSAVLALTAGSMLWYGYVGWKRAGDAVEMQRDSRAAMDVLTRALRAGTNATFTTGLVFTVNCYGKPTASVYASGRSLYYIPDTSAGAQTRLVNGTVARFGMTMSTGVSTVILVLSNGYTSVSNQMSVWRRN